jgi:hypothetical protein
MASGGHIEWAKYVDGWDSDPGGQTALLRVA